jgi:AraC family transcriptional regulator of adaptative response / DNA-3-methyladenine glycosylase II
MREVYGASPRRLRGSAHRPRFERDHSGGTTELNLRLAVRSPFAATPWLAFMAARAVPDVETVADRSYARTLALPHGPAVARLDLPADTGSPGTTFVGVRLRMADVRDLSPAVERCRRLLDADCDPVAVDEHLRADPLLAGLVTRRPGLRVPGTVDGLECAVRTVLGQQVSVPAARTAAHRLVLDHGPALPDELAGAGLSHLFPAAEALAAVPPERLPMPGTRARALVALCAAVTRGDLALDRSRDRAEVRARLLELPGVGPWTADHVALRGLGDPDVLLDTDLGYRTALRTARVPADPQRWRPWRSYALLHLWTSLTDPTPGA